jgi:hypothetical protein
MKVTAIIPDELVNDVKKMTGGATITDSLIIALKSYTSKQRLLKAIERVKKEPLVFQEGFTAAKVRKLNRKV